MLIYSCYGCGYITVTVHAYIMVTSRSVHPVIAVMVISHPQ